MTRISPIKILGSLRLTAWLLFFAVVLVFFGSLDQVHIGIPAAQAAYFKSFMAFWHYPEQWLGGGSLQWLILPIPGGYLLGPLFLLNLFFAHLLHFKPRWSRAGIMMIHAGIALLIIGQGVTDLKQEDSFIQLGLGETTNFLRSYDYDEIAISDVTNPQAIRTVVFPTEHMRAGDVLAHEELPFSLTIKEAYANVSIRSSYVINPPPANPITQGIGKAMHFVVTPLPLETTSGTRNGTTAIVSVDGKPEDTWLLCNALASGFAPQEFTHGDRHFRLALRIKRTYLPFSLTLVDYIHESYPGTEISENLTSRVRISSHATAEEREVTITMNHPLRHKDWAFFQSSRSKNDEISKLEVVENRAWRIPYIASGLVTLGLFYQFGWSLWGFTSRRRDA